MRIPEPTPDFITGYAIFAVAWIAGVVVASIVYRRGRGKPIFPRLPAGALFAEGVASGRSLRNLLTRIGGARNAIQIAVTHEQLVVRPFFPFNLMFLPELLGLEADIPLGRILGVDEQPRPFLRPVMALPARVFRVTFAASDGRGEAMDLEVRNAEAFLHALMHDRRLASLIKAR